MYGTKENTFRNFEAAKMDAEAYSIEDSEIWTVFKKDHDGTMLFQPVKVGDHEQATTDGYVEVPKCTICDREQTLDGSCKFCEDYFREAQKA